MKKIFTIGCFLLVTSVIFAQSDEDLFGSPDDDLFGDDGIVELELPSAQEDASVTNLRKGVLYDAGSVKIGGIFSTSIGTTTTVYADDDKTFNEHLSESQLTPTASAFLTVDARPSETLRMYTKFGMAYPFVSDVEVIIKTTNIDLGEYGELLGIETLPFPTGIETSVKDWFKLKELFTDFSIADTAYFRFGLHTVTWGTGYFFSPVSDMINTSSINPEDTSAQVDGSLNLRTQICFPNTQNCLWFYIVPDTEFTSNYSASVYTKKTAFAGKADLVFGGWEFGIGGLWKWDSATKAMVTFSGSPFGNLNIFGEGIYIYQDKQDIFQTTLGGSYFWKTPAITAAAQYYYDGNDIDITHKYFTHGHNIAGLISFGKVFGTKDLSAAIFGMANFGKEKLSDEYNAILKVLGITGLFNTATFSALLNYNPINEVTISAGPYITVSDWKEAPVVAVKLNFSLGGGKY